MIFEIFTRWNGDRMRGEEEVTEPTGVRVDAIDESNALAIAGRMGTFAGLGYKPSYLGAVARPCKRVLTVEVDVSGLSGAESAHLIGEIYAQCEAGSDHGDAPVIRYRITYPEAT